MRNPFRRRLPVVREVDASVRVGDVWYDQRSAAVLERMEGRVAFRGVTAGFSRIRAMFRGSGEPQAESRAVTSVPWSVGAPSMSSVSQERALRLIPVYAAVRLIADLVSTLPIKAYREAGDVRQPMSRLPQLFQQLDDDGTLLDWLHRCMTSLLLRGNAYGLITERDGMQFPTVIQWLNPDDVHCDDLNPWAPIWYWKGRVVPSEDFVHIPWFTIAGKVQGLSPIEAYASTVNVGLQAQSYASGWFDNGGVPPGTFKNTAKTINTTESDEIKDRLVRAIQSRKPIVYGADWDYNPISISPEQAQFVETARLTASQIAAIYGVPPDMIGGEKGGSYTYSSPEQNSLQLSTLTLRPWLVKLERKFSALLPMRQQIKFNADAIVRADLASRMTAYQVARNIGLRSIDELRALEDLPPLPNGQGQSFAPAPQPQTIARDAGDMPFAGPSFVGEHGPELVYLPGGARKYNPAQPRDPGGEDGGQWIRDPATGFKDLVGAALKGMDAHSAAAYHTDDPAVQKAIDNYGGEGAASYFNVNRNLRDGRAQTPDQQATQDGLDEALDGHRLPHDVVVHRTMSAPWALFGVTQQEWDDAGSKDITGLTWRDQGFVSTAVDPPESGFMMRILVPAGTQAISNEGLDDDEILLDRGLTFRVVADSGADFMGDRNIDVEVVP